MTRYLLDTNIIGHLAKPQAALALVDWIAGRPDESLFIASMTVAEIEQGILILPAGRKRAGLEAWFSGRDGLLRLFRDRVLPFDASAALAWAELMAEGRKAGSPRSPLDMIVAATARSNGCTVVTDNERDFVGLNYLNPLRPREPR